jgi:hypothetical protein
MQVYVAVAVGQAGGTLGGVEGDGYRLIVSGRGGAGGNQLSAEAETE